MSAGIHFVFSVITGLELRYFSTIRNLEKPDLFTNTFSQHDNRQPIMHSSLDELQAPAAGPGDYPPQSAVRHSERYSALEIGLPLHSNEVCRFSQVR